MRKTYLLLGFLILSLSTLTGQSADSSSQPTPAFAGNTSPFEGEYESFPPESKSVFADEEIVKTILVTAFNLVIFLFLLFRIKVDRMEADDYIRVLILTLVICASMYLIAAGWDNQQTAPAFGILGTIAGYLLGKESSRQKTKEPEDS